MQEEEKNSFELSKNRSTRVSPRPREVGDCIILYLSFQFVCAIATSFIALASAQICSNKHRCAHEKNGNGDAQEKNKT